MKHIGNFFRAIWWFVTGLLYNIKHFLLGIFGKIKVSKYPPWIIYAPKGYAIYSKHIRRAMQDAQVGDVFVRYYRCYADGWFIPGRFSHSGIYVGDGIIIHALGNGVQKTDVIDFMRCDGFAILRPKCDQSMKEKAVKIATGYIGFTYDFDFDICEDYKNQAEVQKRTKSVYCHELTRSCFPDLDIPCIAPSLWHGMIRSSKKQFLAQSFFDSPDFEVVYDSDYSEVQSGNV